MILSVLVQLQNIPPGYSATYMRRRIVMQFLLDTNANAVSNTQDLVQVENIY